jgi:hypothetical protein
MHDLNNSNTGEGAELASGSTKSAMKQVREIPLWRTALFYFVITSSLAIGIHSLLKLRSIGQPVSDMILDDLGIAALFALIMTVREWLR